jgi:predicted DNA-binding transcriptional regulator AlpA
MQEKPISTVIGDVQPCVKPECETVPAPGRTITALATLPEKTLLDECSLAAALKLSKRTVRRMVSRHELPPPFRFGGKSTWISGKVLDHIEARAEREARDAERAARKLEALA